MSGCRKNSFACARDAAARNALLSVRYARVLKLLNEPYLRKDENRAELKKRFIRCDLQTLDNRLLELLEKVQFCEVLDPF